VSCIRQSHPQKIESEVYTSLSLFVSVRNQVKNAESHDISCDSAFLTRLRQLGGSLVPRFSR
jgi:hypothetical protein